MTTDRMDVLLAGGAGLSGQRRSRELVERGELR